jgi:signal transduction histidine kinase
VFNALIHGLDKHPDPEIYLHFSVDGRMVCLQFGDNGCGMDEETRKKVFQIFFSTKG